MLIRASNVCVIASAAEATLHVNSVRQAPQLALLTTIVPEIWHRPISQGTAANVQATVRLWARHGLEGRLAAEPALRVHIVGIAAQHPLRAIRLVVIWHCRNVSEGANLRAWAMDVGELGLAAMAALHILAIGVATKHAQDTTRLPIGGNIGLRLEGARNVWRSRRTFWARHCTIREIAAEATLGVATICQTAELTQLTTAVPVVRDIRLLSEVASAGWARHIYESATTTDSTLLMLPISIATEPTIFTVLASWVPEGANTRWLSVELAFATDLCAPLLSRCQLQQHCSEVESRSKRLHYFCQLGYDGEATGCG